MSERISFKTLSSDTLYTIKKEATIQEIQKSVALLFITDYWLIDIVNLEHYFIYEPDQTSDILPDPFHVMVGAQSRPVHGLRTSTKPDLVWEYESDPRIEVTCGHAITPDNLYGLVRRNILQTEYRMICPGKTAFGPCEQEWNNVEILKSCVLSADEYLFFSEKLSFNFLNKKRDCEIKICPGCYSYCERLSDMDSHVKCLKCSSSSFNTFKFCWNCLQNWTPDHSCYLSNNSSNNEEIRRQLNECSKVTLDYSHMCGVPSKRLCPNCKALLQHDQACKSMLCTFCNTEFCFACLQIASNGKLPCGDFDRQCIVAPIQFTDY